MSWVFRRNNVAPAIVALGSIAGVGSAQIPLSPTAQASGAQLTTSHGIEFVTVDVHNNPAFTDPAYEGFPVYGHGSVAEPFRIGRYEVTTAQWTAFYNAWSYVSATQGSVPFVQIPGGGNWGAVSAGNPYGAGQGWAVPAGNEMRPVGNISWRTAAIYCNWLCNGQALTRDAFMNGAYDVNTFGYVNATFTDQFVHNPGAQYFIPTLDQWMVAAHYDPNRFGVGQPGYWLWANARDTATPMGPPGVGEANWGFFDGQNLIPLGAYPFVQSPWGLLDTAGATSEWLEDVRQLTTGERYRFLDGSGWYGMNVKDMLGGWGADFPSFSPNNYGFRIASAVPSPIGAMLAGPLALFLRRRRTNSSIRTPSAPA